MRAGRGTAGQKGVTLVELTIAVSLMAVVLATAAPILHAVHSNWTVKKGNDESLANARSLLHHVHLQLSQALRVTSVSDAGARRGYIQFVGREGGELRYEIGPAEDVEFGPPGELAPLAGPVSVLRLICYDDRDLASPVTDVNSIRFVRLEVTFPNAAALGRDHTLSTGVYIRAADGNTAPRLPAVGAAEAAYGTRRRPLRTRHTPGSTVQ